jgi:hypothetical protein
MPKQAKRFDFFMIFGSGFIHKRIDMKKDNPVRLSFFLLARRDLNPRQGG